MLGTGQRRCPPTPSGGHVTAWPSLNSIHPGNISVPWEAETSQATFGGNVFIYRLKLDILLFGEGGLFVRITSYASTQAQFLEV